jgi:sulfite reductase alpha subunit-like flavoprotein
MTRYNQRERRSLLEVLQDFSAAAPPLELLLECAPLLAPRLFSLASAPMAHPGRAAILMAVVRWTTPTNRLRKGLLSNWLAGLQPAEAAGGAGGNSSSSDPANEKVDCTGIADSDCAGQLPAANGELQIEHQQRNKPWHHQVCVPVWIERGALRLPPSLSTPLLLVGPGTGVAPFRSFLWQRAAIQQQQQQQQGCAVQHSSVASCTLFFGCRSPLADFYYKSEWHHLLQTQVLQQPHGFIAAFSRHSPQPNQQQLLQQLQQAANDSSKLLSAVDRCGSGGSTDDSKGAVNGSKVYVTDKLREHGSQVWQLLSEEGAWVFVSGSAEKMPAGVAAALQDVAVQHGGLTAEAAEKFVRQLELSGRYHVEAWS